MWVAGAPTVSEGSTMIPHVLAGFPLFLLLLLAAHSDLRTRRIPNRLTLAGVAVGLVSGAVLGGWGGLGEAALGGLAGLGVFLLLYLMRAMGAGDVKLMAAAGTFLGFPLVLWGAVCSALAGGLLVAFVALRSRSVGRVATGTWHLLTLGPRQGAFGDASLTLDDPHAIKVPYGVAIAAGCAFAALLPHLSVF